ncbi:hypothetical protein BFJ70_g2624 [Fusarium oxysporum]|nr:hypothetical protein BFJ70_g2624 [Fusarium oxysporum]
MTSSENDIDNRGNRYTSNGSHQHPPPTGASDVLRLSKGSFTDKAAIEAGKQWNKIRGRNSTLCWATRLVLAQPHISIFL